MNRILLVLKDRDGNEWLLPALAAEEATSVTRMEAIPAIDLQEAQPIRVMGLRFVIDDDAARKIPQVEEQWQRIRSER